MNNNAQAWPDDNVAPESALQSRCRRQLKHASGKPIPGSDNEFNT
jgi:hypothetical protein